jgi:hypothetical protein
MSRYIVPEFRRCLSKQPFEEIECEADFSSRLPAYFGELASATFIAEKWPISNPTAKVDGNDIFVDADGVIEAPHVNRAKVMLKGGDVNFDYHVTCRAVTAEGEKLERDFYVRIREL